MSLSDASGHFHLVLLSVRTLGQIRDLKKNGEKKLQTTDTTGITPSSTFGQI